MPTKSRSQRKTQPAKEARDTATTDISDVGIATETDTTDGDELLTTSTQHYVEEDMENEQTSSLAQLENNSAGQVNESASRENAAGETSVSDRSKKRRRTANKEVGDTDKEPAVKRSKKKKDAQQVAESQNINTAEESVTDDDKRLDAEGESQMETDDDDESEQDIKDQEVTGSESEFTTTPIKESVMPNKTAYNQQQMLSSITNSSAKTKSRDVWQSSTDSRHRGYFTSESPEAWKRTTAPQIHDESVHQRQQKFLQTYRSDRINAPSAVSDEVAESGDQKQENRCKRLCSILKYVVILLGVVSAVLIACLLTTGGGNDSSQSTASIKVPISGSVSFERLRKEFSNQSERLWRIIEAATLPIVEEDNPLHPAVILLVAARGNTAVAECLAQRYAALVTESLNAATHAMINCESYAASDPDEAKSHLDTVLSRSFDAGSKSAVVLRLEKLPGPAAMIFYRFAENDNAPYKDVAIVITVTLESTDTGSERDHVAFDELRKVWASSLDADKVEPLLSRIGNSVAFVRPETKETLADLNC